MSKRIRSKKVLSESESEAEAFAPDGSEAAAEDVEKAKENNADLAIKKKKSFRNCRGRLDSEGDTDDENNLENSMTSANPRKKLKSHSVNCVEQIGRKERGSSRRRKMEKEKRKKATKQTKKEKKQEEKVR